MSSTLVVEENSWTAFEKLLLVQLVYKLQDNWAAVCRDMRRHPMISHPAEFFTQKNCATKYKSLIEPLEIEAEIENENKKKSGDFSSSFNDERRMPPAAKLARILYQERIRELKSMVSSAEQRFRTIVTEIDDIRSGKLDSQLVEILKDEQKKKEKSGQKASDNKEQTYEQSEEIVIEEVLISVNPPEVTSKTVDKLAISDEKMDIDENNNDMITDDNNINPLNTKEGQEGQEGREGKLTDIRVAGEPNKDNSEKVQEQQLIISGLSDKGKDIIMMDIDAKSVENPQKTLSVDLPKPEQVMRLINENTSPQDVISEDTPQTISGDNPMDVDESPETNPSTSPVHYSNKLMNSPKELTPKNNEVLVQSEEEMEVNTENIIDDDTNLQILGDSSHSDVKGEKENVPVKDESSVVKQEFKEPLTPSAGVIPSTPSGVVNTTTPAAMGLPSTPGDAARTPHGSEIAPTPGGGEPSESSSIDDKKQKTWHKLVTMILQEISNHRYASVFQNPIREQDAPGYYDIVKQPMDLRTLKKRLRDDQFHRDLMLMFMNASVFNRKETDIHQMATEMKDFVENQISEFRRSESSGISGGVHEPATRRKSMALEGTKQGLFK
ncbi:3726_t:CDS:2 [Diversispora eburnea]|uniref:3726_t:CDS:1 n=1 Tax=Diversispora eburnea TaxID=1213867 RepID=A0A9N9AB81_9GLOM|nr:3726_t:CDS:2 [Diversispora eburnea]